MENGNSENVENEMRIDDIPENVNAGGETNLTNDPGPQPELTLNNEVEEAKRKKRRRDEQDAEAKRLADEAYDRDMHEQRYKRLMHLLDKSQFYASYIIDKICKSPQKLNSKLKKKEKVKAANDENVPPPNRNKAGRSRIKPNYDIRDYIPRDVQKNMKSTKINLNLSEEEIEEELNTASDTEAKEGANVSQYFKGILRDYQVKGVQWLKVLYENGLNGILADEMGLGKTVQIIALFCYLIEKQQDGPYLIVAPLSTIPNWLSEFERFAPKIPVVLFHGSAEDKSNLYQRIRQKYYVSGSYRTQPIVLTTFEYPLRERKFLMSQKWRYIVVDEGHRIKNRECQLVKVLEMLHSMNRLLLTGTPLQNDLAELWSLLHFLLPEIFDDLAVFESWFDVKELQAVERTKKILKQEQEKRVLSMLREILKPFMLRREKSDVCLELPGKKEVLVYAPITQLQRDLYRAVLNRDIQTMTKLEEESTIIPMVDGKRAKRQCVMRKYQSGFVYEDESPSSPTSSEGIKEVNKDDKDNLSMWQRYTDVNDRNLDFLVHIQFRNRMSMYKKIVNHPYLVHCPLNSDGLPKIDENLVKASGKLLMLDAILPKLRKDGHKVLLFSTMTMMLNMIEDYLSLRDYEYLRLDGSTDIEVRKENIAMFNNDPDIFLFLISTRAGGIGINLASADTVIIYDSDWNPQVDIQAMARCHRIGQKRPVVIYRFCTRGTIDEIIVSRGESKRMLEKLVISKEANSINLTNKESLIALKQFLESKECQVVTSENEVFTEAELNKLLDRSDI